MGRLFRLTQKLVNTPQLTTVIALEGALEFLQSRNELEAQLAIVGGPKRSARQLCYNEDTGVGYLSIDGPLTYVEYAGMCGEESASYQRLEAEFDAMAEAGAKTVVLDFDTPGGEAYGCFETAKNLRTKADRDGIKLIGYVDGLCASAGIGLAVACHEIIVNPMAEVGSIGVVVSLANVSQAEKKIGIERTYVFAGESKIPFDSDGKFTAGFLSDIQEKVDTLYDSFISHVAEMRNLSQDAVRDTKAKVFSADKALELGLVDQMMTREDFFAYLADVVESGENMSLKSKLFKSTTMESNDDMAKLEEMQVELTAALGAKEAVEATLATMQTELSASQTQLTAAMAELETFKAKADAAEKEAAELAQAARKQQLVAAAGEAKADSLFPKLQGLDDTAFAEVVETIREANKAVDDSAAFKELGVDGDGKVEDQEKAGLNLVGQLIAKDKTK